MEFGQRKFDATDLIIQMVQAEVFSQQRGELYVVVVIIIIVSTRVD